MIFGDAEDDGDDVLRGVAEPPQVRHDLVGLINVAVDTVLEHVLDKKRVGLIANLKKEVIK